MDNAPFSIPEPLIAALRAARHVAVLTGAGVSAESGVPTFRDAQTGLWARYDPQELATPEAFLENPQLVWEWYAWRRELVSRAEPNPGHLALAELEGRLPRFTLITQNVDGLHQRAGSRAVLELHGNIARTKCFREGVVVETWEDSGEVPPRCPRCGAHLRPDVVWFGESLSHAVLQQAFEAADDCDVFLSIGTSGLVQPAASLPIQAYRSGAVLAIINPDPGAIPSPNCYPIAGPSGQVLPAILSQGFSRG